MFDTWNERSPRWWAVVPLRLTVGYGFIAHGLAKWDAGPEKFGKLLAVIGTPSPGATAWAASPSSRACRRDRQRSAHRFDAGVPYPILEMKLIRSTRPEPPAYPLTASSP